MYPWALPETRSASAHRSAELPSFIRARIRKPLLWAFVSEHVDAWIARRIATVDRRSSREQAQVELPRVNEPGGATGQSCRTCAHPKRYRRTRRPGNSVAGSAALCLRRTRRFDGNAGGATYIVASAELLRMRMFCSSSRRGCRYRPNSSRTTAPTPRARAVEIVVLDEDVAGLDPAIAADQEVHDRAVSKRASPDRKACRRVHLEAFIVRLLICSGVIVEGHQSIRIPLGTFAHPLQALICEDVFCRGPTSPPNTRMFVAEVMNSSPVFSRRRITLRRPGLDVPDLHRHVRELEMRREDVQLVVDDHLCLGRRAEDNVGFALAGAGIDQLGRIGPACHLDDRARGCKAIGSVERRARRSLRAVVVVAPRRRDEHRRGRGGGERRGRR